MFKNVTINMKKESKTYWKGIEQLKMIKSLSKMLKMNFLNIYQLKEVQIILEEIFLK